MAIPKVFVGARAKCFIDNVLVGIFDSVSWAENIGAEPIPLLGTFGPAEIVATSYEAVTVNCSGFRIIGNGTHKLPKFPKPQGLLNLETIQLAIVDRQSTDNKPVFVVDGCVPINNSGGVNAKTTSRVQLTYLGLVASDEDGINGEVNAVDLP